MAGFFFYSLSLEYCCYKCVKICSGKVVFAGVCRRTVYEVGQPLMTACNKALFRCVILCALSVYNTESPIPVSCVW